jgi:tripartite-type tricarboxylate transporter receptor subunit TctC
MSNTRNRYPGRRRFLKQSAALSAGAASLATPAIVLGQGAPAATAQAVRILVGAPPGGTTDTVARAVATDMARALGQPVIVENRSGAGGNVAAEAVAHSAADGATLLVAFSSHTINATLYPALPFDPVADFTPITMLTTSPSLLIGHPALPANSLAELVTLLQKNPGKYDFGIGAPGSSLHMAGERFKLDTGTFVGSIPYRGSAPALQGLVAGQVQLMFVSPAIGGAQLKAGKVKAFGTTATRRLPQFPEVPAIAEVVKGFASNAWMGLFGPAKLPADVTQRLYEAARGALAQPDVRKRFDTEALEPVGNSPAEFARFVQDDIRRWAKVARYSGAKPE